jgi:hypothetical protein
VQEGRRNVHAFANGTLSAWEDVPVAATRVRYDRHDGSFKDELGITWSQCREAWLSNDGSLWCVERVTECHKPTKLS